MIMKLLRVLWRLAKWERIPRLPRGMLAESYRRQLAEDEARVVSRLGARSPGGLRIAMRRAGAANVDELVEQLDHFRVRRRVMRNLDRMINRATFSTPYDPHQRAIDQAARRKSRGAASAGRQRRIVSVGEAFRE